MPNYAHYDSISTKDHPALCFADAAGVTAPANIYPDEANTDTVIPLHILNYSTPNVGGQITPTSLIPLIDEQSNLAYGGTLLTRGTSTLPKITIDGHIDTPLFEQASGSQPRGLPTVIAQTTTGTTWITYGDLIAIYFEGRATTDSEGNWRRVQPKWFRDPYGRVYLNPKIIEYTANYVEQVPGRTSFTMAMVI